MKKFAIIGYPLTHSRSKTIHTQIMQLANIDGQYEVIEIPPEKLDDFIPQLMELDGFSITIPFKQQIIPYINELDKTAGLYGSVNTVKCGGISKGYNTDCIGFLRSLEQADIKLSGKVLLLGAGGVSRTFAFESAIAGCNIDIAVRTSSFNKADNIKQEIYKKIAYNGQINILDINAIDKTKQYDLMINGTPVGMYPKIDGCPVKDRIIQNCAAVFDAVYNPQITLLLEKAKANGAKIVKGLPMLIYQAIAQQEIWNDKILDIPFDQIKVEL